MSTTATTKHGTVRGTVEDGVSVFRGIPYAAPPVGPLRYRPPAPPARWEGERDATAYGPPAPQHLPEGLVGELFTPELPWGEDCLRLNVWTPAVDRGARPVIVFVHGGAFLFGSGGDPYIDKGRFARSGVVQVSINYRLGIDGFLAVDGDADGGNYGTLDIVAALRWVQENIAAFGGDPERVTLAGESAGATAVAAVLGVPAARGLFARAIVQSGYPQPLLSRTSAALAAREVFARAGLADGDLDGLRELRDREPARVVAIQGEIFADVLADRDPARWGEEIASTANPFQPVVGGSVLPLRPADAFAAGEAAPVDLLIGHTKEEFLLMFGIGLVGAGDDLVAAAFDGVFGAGGADALALYSAARPGARPVELLAALETDRAYRVPTTNLADAHSASGATTFFYRFSWPSRAFDGAIGAGHAVELPFVFDILDTDWALRLTGEQPPQQLADDMHLAWVSFAETGDPTHDGIPAWPLYDRETRPILDFGEQHEVIHDPWPEELRLWTQSTAGAAPS